MKCAGCSDEIKAGDRFIRGAPSAFLGREADAVDALVADMLGGAGGEIAYCEACTQEGGRFTLEVFHGER